MSIFSAIKNAIFGHKAAQPAAPAATPAPAPGQPTPAAEAPTPQQPVDVGAVLTQIAAEKGNPALNYKTSIVDLMKLLDLDSSLSNREQLATELGYTGAKDGSAEMNIWLHQAVMTQLEKNGGTVPADLKH